MSFGAATIDYFDLAALIGLAGPLATLVGAGAAIFIGLKAWKISNKQMLISRLPVMSAERDRIYSLIRDYEAAIKFSDNFLTVVASQPNRTTLKHDIKGVLGYDMDEPVLVRDMFDKAFSFEVKNIEDKVRTIFYRIVNPAYDDEEVVSQIRELKMFSAEEVTRLKALANWIDDEIIMTLKN